MRAVLLFLSIICSYGLLGQTKIVERDFPAPKGSLIFCPREKVLLLIGGISVVPDSAKSDVWKWNGKSWSKISARGPGSVSFSNGIALNEATGIIYAYGGYDMLDDPKEDTWSFDGSRWSKVNANKVGNRIHHALVYDAHLQAFVLYGGFDENRDNDTTTWLLKGRTFTPMNLPGPGPRHQFAMVYDKQRKKVVLYGGTEGSNEHWEFDGSRWIRVNLNETPGDKARHHMIYDDDLKRIILFGGDPQGSPSTTWTFDGSSWKKIASDDITAFTLGYDQHRHVAVIYGETPESELCVWELQDEKWKKVSSFGLWDRMEYQQAWMKNHPGDIMGSIEQTVGDFYSQKYPEAEIGFKKIESVFPKNKMIVINITFALLKQGKSNEAEEYLRKIEASGHLTRPQYARLGTYLIAVGQYQHGINYMNKALTIKPRGIDYYSLGCAYALSKNPDNAFVALSYAVKFGFNSRQQFEGDADLESLRSDSRWIQLLTTLK